MYHVGELSKYSRVNFFVAYLTNKGVINSSGNITYDNNGSSDLRIGIDAAQKVAGYASTYNDITGKLPNAGTYGNLLKGVSMVEHIRSGNGEDAALEGVEWLANKAV